jgi:hypothetical protein
VSQIAVLLDHYSLAYLAQGNALSKPLLTDQFGALAALGAPYDVWLLDDLIGGRMPEYSLYIVLNAFALDAKARQAVRKVVARDDKTVLWVFAPGAIDRTFSGSAALDLTGLSIGFVTHEAPVRVRILDPSHPLVDGLPKGMAYGTTASTGPIFYALPNRGDIIGMVGVPARPNADARDWPGLLFAEMEDWTSIYSAAPNVPVDILRGIARHAAVHFYTDPGDVVLANASMLAVHARQGGDKGIRLRWPADVWDILTGEKLGTDVHELALAMAAGETRLLYTGDTDRFEPR